MNIERMRAVAADVLTHAEQFDMSSWFVRSRWPFSAVGDIPEEGLDQCGTTCCIAGDAVLMARAEWFTMKGNEHIEDVAARYLGLTGEQAERLFYLVDWDPDLRTRYRNSPDAIGRAQAAVEQIERMIAEEEAANAKEI